MTWEEWQKTREQKRAALKRYSCDIPSRRKASYNTAERFMRKEFGGARVPEFVKTKPENRGNLRV